MRCAVRTAEILLLASSASAGVTWFQAANGQLATFGVDAVIWIPIIIQILSFITTALESRPERPQRRYPLATISPG